jgi:hypothetical protein
MAVDSKREFRDGDPVQQIRRDENTEDGASSSLLLDGGTPYQSG